MKEGISGRTGPAAQGEILVDILGNIDAQLSASLVPIFDHLLIQDIHRGIFQKIGDILDVIRES